MSELAELQAKVKLLEAGSIFNDGAEEKDVERACVDYLKSLGYKINKKPILSKVNNTNELIDLFYNFLEFNHNETCSLISNRKKDCAILSNFIKVRQKELGCSKKECLQDCANIITTMFTYEEELGLTVPIGIWVFGSDRCKWITDKVINILNSSDDLINDAIVTRMVEEDEHSSEEYTGFDFNKLRSMYGKEERS